MINSLSDMFLLCFIDSQLFETIEVENIISSQFFDFSEWVADFLIYEIFDKFTLNCKRCQKFCAFIVIVNSW